MDARKICEYVIDPRVGISVAEHILHALIHVKVMNYSEITATFDVQKEATAFGAS